MASNGVNNLRLNITEKDVTDHLNEDCLKLNEKETICFCDTDLCNTGNNDSSEIFIIQMLLIFALVII